MTEIRSWAAWGGLWSKLCCKFINLPINLLIIGKEQKKMFWSDGNVLYPIYNGGYMAIYIGQNYFTAHLK